MAFPIGSRRTFVCRGFWLLTLALFLASFWLPNSQGQPAKLATLRIGASSRLGQDSLDQEQAKTALDTLRSFIKSETGFDNEIVPLDTYEELAGKLAGKELHLAVFQGFEFAWAQDKHAGLRALALAVNWHAYRYAHVMIRHDSKFGTFAELKGRALVLPNIGQRHVQLFVERQCLALGQEPKAFSSKIATPDNVEDALDDVVDGMMHAAIVDRVGLEAYQRRKPGRFRQLKELLRSEAFPPPVVAYQDGAVDDKTLQRFRDGLLQARTKEKGQRLLTLFKLTGFEAVPKDFKQVLEATRKTYPAPAK